MSYLRGAAIAALSVTLFCSLPAMAAEPVGEAVLIKTEVTGATGPLAVDALVHRDERIRTSRSGLGQFLFLDGTKLAVGWGSSVVIDKFVFDDSKSVKKLTIKAAKGTFRWISGNSKSSAYEILTPAGTIGVRGTAFDFYVGADGTTAVVLLNGSAQFCGAGGCKQLTRRCDCVVAKRNGDMTDTRRVNRNIFKTLGNTRALPFLSGNQQLAGGLGITGTGCGLGMAAANPSNNNSPRDVQAPSPAPNTPDPPDPPSKPDTQPDTPSAPDKPSKPDTPDTPNKPDPPSKPDKPDKPDKPHHPGKHHGKGHGHHDKDGDRHDEDNDRRDRGRHDDDRHDGDHHDEDNGRRDGGHHDRGKSNR